MHVPPPVIDDEDAWRPLATSRLALHAPLHLGAERALREGALLHVAPTRTLQLLVISEDIEKEFKGGRSMDHIGSVKSAFGLVLGSLFVA